MKLLKITLILLLTIIILFIILTGKNNATICFNENCIEAEIADTPETKMSGLMFREQLQENEGMLFVYDEEGVYPFWMKNTYIPLDIIWIDEDFRIKHIEYATPCKADPCQTYNPNTNAKYVLETNAGFTNQYNIKLGDKTAIAF
ncbi:MAG: DUF192 domain-containing protein [archaeon]